MNKICAALNDNQLKKQKQHAEQLLQNQDKAKRFRFRRDQLQPKVQTAFPMMEDLLKDVSDGKSLLGMLMFYHPTVINLEGISCTVIYHEGVFKFVAYYQPCRLKQLLFSFLKR